MRYALAAALLVACSASPALAPRDCTPGASVVCACPGASGVQTCGADGTLGACVCADGGAGDAADAPPAEDRPAVDAAAMDAPPSRADAPPVPDVAPDAPTPMLDAGSPRDAFVAPDVVCSIGEVICGGGSALSPGRCVDIRTDSANCGACGRACPAPWENSAPTCRPGGICEFNCAPGWINCDGRIENGCERTLDATDCRTCGNNCPYPLTCALDGRCVPS